MTNRKCLKRKTVVGTPKVFIEHVNGQTTKLFNRKSMSSKKKQSVKIVAVKLYRSTTIGTS